ncbi:MAG TPA: tetratricopeptide repeat protein [Elusimicrobiota bacterium]|nr:tetratricopeptide repeat protein [Elusimicrobiota bacterium]
MNPRRFPRAPAAAVAAAALLSCLPILRNGFVWDDAVFFVQNAGLRGFDPVRLRWMLTTFHMGQWRPLSWLAWALVHAAFGLEPWAYHALSLALHAGCALAFYRLALAIVDAPAALGAALLFALHPLRVESVAWASNAHALLADLFYILAALVYLRRRPRACLALQALSLLSKADAVTLPVVLLALDLYPLRRLRLPPRPRELAALLREKLPYLVLSLAGALVALRAQHAAGNLARLETHGPGSRLAQLVFSSSFYLRQTFLPGGFSPLYPLRPLSLLDPGVLLSAGALAAAAFLLKKTKVPVEARAALWLAYAALLLPVAGLFQNGVQLTALRYSYLACLGWTLAAGAGLARLGSRFPKAVAAAGAALAIGAVAADWTLAARWKDDAALWSWAAERQPGSRIAVSNACHATISARDPRAERFCGAAADLLPEDAGLQTAIGLALVRGGDPARALEHFAEAARLEPRSARALGNEGSVLAMVGRLDEAVELLSRAARLDPDDAEIRKNLERARAQARRRPLKE